MPTRRRFLSLAARAAPCAPLAASATGSALTAWAGTQDLARTAPVARFWAPVAAPGGDCGACHVEPAALDRRHTHAAGAVACQLCAQRCLLRRGERGRCRARMNVGGELRSLVYGRPVAVHVDPIEKKPFYHFLPGRTAYSLGTAGCPLSCRFCQNWEISQARPEDFPIEPVSPAQVVAAAAATPIVAFTYNEPTVFIEYLLDVAALARTRGLRAVLVSCGFMNEAPLAEMCRALDAVKIDLKGFSDEFYRTVSHAALRPVLRSIAQIHRSGVHLELVNLVVPTLNDHEATLRGLVEWVAGELGPDVPVHFTRFHPDYQLLNLPPTPVATLERARELAMDGGLRYVYVGNVPGHPGNHTYCPSCRRIVIARESFFVTDYQVRNGACAFCGTKIAGVWENGEQRPGGRDRGKNRDQG